MFPNELLAMSLLQFSWYDANFHHVPHWHLSSFLSLSPFVNVVSLIDSTNSEHPLCLQLLQVPTNCLCYPKWGWTIKYEQSHRGYWFVTQHKLRWGAGWGKKMILGKLTGERKLGSTGWQGIYTCTVPGKRIPDAGSVNAKTSGERERLGSMEEGGGCGSWDMASKEEWRRMRWGGNWRGLIKGGTQETA